MLCTWNQQGLQSGRESSGKGFVTEWGNGRGNDHGIDSDWFVRIGGGAADWEYKEHATIYPRLSGPRRVQGPVY